MSYSTAHDIREQVRQATDVVELIGADIPLRRQGRVFVGLCPWHPDTRPSLQVNPERQSWKCWVCDLGGDVYDYLMRREGGIGFREALEMLAERAGISVKTVPQTAAKPGTPQDKNTLYKALAWAELQYHQCLLNAAEAAAGREYLKRRQISEESIARYRLGFAPNQWHWLMDRGKNTPWSSEVLEAVGLALRGERGGRLYDRFRGRVLFPIRDVQGRPVGLGGRVLPQLADEKSAKYINSPETRLFTKHEHLYGLDIVRDRVARDRHVVVVEGYTDVVIARQYGVDNIAAVLGTALGPRHVTLLKRYADRITLVLDGDEAGQRRAAEVLELFVASQVDLRIVSLPSGLDPCDFVIGQGADAFRELVETAVDALEHQVRTLSRGFDPAVDTHQANRALEQILQTLGKAPRLQADTTTGFRLREQQILSRLAREFRIEEAVLRERLTALRRKSRAPGAPAGPSPEEEGAMDSWQRELFALLIRNPEASSVVLENIAEDDLESSLARELLAIYRQLAAAGIAPDFHRLLDAIESPRLKSLVVELDEAGTRIDAVDYELQLRDVLEAFRRRRHARARRLRLAKLETGNLNEKEQLELLTQLIEEERNRQGISAPTDG